MKPVFQPLYEFKEALAKFNHYLCTFNTIRNLTGKPYATDESVENAYEELCVHFDMNETMTHTKLNQILGLVK